MQNKGNGMNSKVWFITGASRGFGRIWAEAALERGDKVAATARTLESIAGLEEKHGDRVLVLELRCDEAPGKPGMLWSKLTRTSAGWISL